MLNESKNAYDFNYKMDFLEPVINYIESNPSFATPLVKMLYYCIKLLENDKDEYFENLKEIVYKNFEIIDKNDRYDMFIVLISHCNKKINEGNIRFVRELFNIYIKFLKNDALMPNGFMHHLTYKIIVNCALSLQELKWAENFIETYKPYLKDKHRNSTYYFSKARLYFVKCEYEKAIDCFGKVGMVDISYKYDTKWQMARTYYELGEIDSFLPLIDSYKHLLAKNKKISSKSRKTQLRQIGYLIKLFKLRNNFNGAALNKLKAEFLNNEYIIGRSWFLKKTDEIFLSRASAKAV
jgi:tetratricopeptide (TPR) repeat protein